MAKYALCIGLNYPGTSAELSGCVNDAMDWREALAARGYDARAFVEAPKAELVQLLRETVGRAKYRDGVVITYSGHGSYVPDADGDEPDARDECWCPADVFSGNVLTDDELFDLLADRERGVRVTVISDSCHSGTVSRMAPPEGGRVPKVRFLPPASFLPRELVPPPRSFPVPRKFKTPALLVSGCQDWEFSYDAWFGDRANGAFTRAAVDALAGLDDRHTYRTWWRAIRQKLPSGSYPQSPNLLGTSTQKGWRVLD